MMGNSMAMFYLKTIPWILAIYSASIIYWNTFNKKQNGWYYFMVILIATFIIKIILAWVIERCLPRFRHESDRGLASDKFTHDYD